MSIPFIDLKTQYAAIKESVNRRIQDVLEHGQYILGPEVQECEKALSDYTGSQHTLTCASGTDALVIALMALGIGPGDEVIVPGFSFIATAETVVLVGAQPVFVDIRRDTYNIDPQKIEAAITDKTKAIIPVGLYGQPSDMSEINELAQKHSLFVIEDAAQSFGAEYRGKKSGNLSSIGCTSFFPAKPLGCYGDGGAVFTDSSELHEKLISLRMHGQAPEERYKHIQIGTNARMDTLQCAILLAKLERFPWEVEQRQIIANRYFEKLSPFSETGKLTTPTILEGRSSVFAQFTIWLKNRDEFLGSMKEKGIPVAVHYPLPMYKQPAYQEMHKGESLENSDWASRGVVSLPMHPDLDERTQDHIVSAITDFLS